MSIHRSIFILTTVALALGARAAETAITPEAREFFESKIRPVLVSECNECHSAAKHKGGLRLDHLGSRLALSQAPAAPTSTWTPAAGNAPATTRP